MIRRISPRVLASSVDSLLLLGRPVLDEIIWLPFQHKSDDLYEYASEHVHVCLLGFVNSRSLSLYRLLVPLEAKIEAGEFICGRRLCQLLARTATVGRSRRTFARNGRLPSGADYRWRCHAVGFKCVDCILSFWSSIDVYLHWIWSFVSLECGQACNVAEGYVISLVNEYIGRADGRMAKPIPV